MQMGVHPVAVGLALVLLHALNPYGMCEHRRVNEGLAEAAEVREASASALDEAAVAGSLAHHLRADGFERWRRCLAAALVRARPGWRRRGPPF